MSDSEHRTQKIIQCGLSIQCGPCLLSDALAKDACDEDFCYSSFEYRRMAAKYPYVLSKIEDHVMESIHDIRNGKKKPEFPRRYAIVCGMNREKRVFIPDDIDAKHLAQAAKGEGPFVDGITRFCAAMGSSIGYSGGDAMEAYETVELVTAQLATETIGNHAASTRDYYWMMVTGLTREERIAALPGLTAAEVEHHRSRIRVAREIAQQVLKMGTESEEENREEAVGTKESGED